MTYQHASDNNPQHPRGVGETAEDPRLQPDSELALTESSASTWKTVVAFAAMIFAIVVVLYGLNNQRVETEQVPPPAATTPPAQTQQPAAPQGGTQPNANQAPAPNSGQPPAPSENSSQPSQNTPRQPAPPKSQGSPQEPQGKTPAADQKQ